MSLLQTNILKLNNGQYVKFSHLDDWHRMIFTFEDGKKYCLLDEVKFYSITSEGEPDCPLKAEWQPKNTDIFKQAKDSQISCEAWEDYFEPVMEEEDDGEIKFPFYEDAVDFANKRYCRKAYQHIWSIVEGDSGRLVLLNGFHKVNVLDYLVCDTPWGIGEDSDKDVYLEVRYEE